MTVEVYSPTTTQVRNVMNDLAARILVEHLATTIPLTEAMKVSVQDASVRAVALTAPLAPNVNDARTVFGGSASALALMAAWSLVHVRLESVGLGSQVVTQSSTVNYALPITGAFVATASCTDERAWERFCQTLERHRRARIEIAATLSCDGLETGTLTGRFVAFWRPARAMRSPFDAGQPDTPLQSLAGAFPPGSKSKTLSSHFPRIHPIHTQS